MTGALVRCTMVWGLHELRQGNSVEVLDILQSLAPLMDCIQNVSISSVLESASL